jgi:hypothetical protein
MSVALQHSSADLVKTSGGPSFGNGTQQAWRQLSSEFLKVKFRFFIYPLGISTTSPVGLSGIGHDLHIQMLLQAREVNDSIGIVFLECNPECNAGRMGIPVWNIPA